MSFKIAWDSHATMFAKVVLAGQSSTSPEVDSHSHKSYEAWYSPPPNVDNCIASSPLPVIQTHMKNGLSHSQATSTKTGPKHRCIKSCRHVRQDTSVCRSSLLVVELLLCNCGAVWPVTRSATWTVEILQFQRRPINPALARDPFYSWRYPAITGNHRNITHSNSVWNSGELPACSKRA